MANKKVGLWNMAVVVAALGYFVDIYDLLLFSIVRVPSLRSIGYEGRELAVGAILANIQMAGLVIGGILWGVLGDLRGRLSVLFGSIFLYSVANFLNGFVEHFTQYAFLRFFAGLGLAGELGAGITLVAEVLPAKTRGYGTMIVATVGVMGAVVGGLVGQHFDWRTAYIIGGSLGFLLLIFRIGVAESGMFKNLSSHKKVKRGNILMLFTDGDRFGRFANCVLVGVPIWFTIGILITYSPEFAKVMEIVGTPTAAYAVLYCYVGFVIGDFASGMISQFIESRTRAIGMFIVFNAIVTAAYLFSQKGASVNVFYGMCILLGTSAGYWAVVVTSAAEQFGTNLRATVTTTVPNLIRGALIPMNAAFLSLKEGMGTLGAASVVGAASIVIALFATSQLKDTYGKDLNFVEGP